jgi:uncharacterized protein involved in type VI secretion and phage assembly
MSERCNEFFGKYRGVVSDNADPNMIGRIRARVPDVYGEEESGWAMPCVPYAGDGVGLYLIPPTGASVWIEFEHGDPDYPIWSGCFWGTGQVPATPATAETKVLKTDVGTITINDAAGVGGITIETTDGMTITLSNTGIEIDGGMGEIAVNGTSVSLKNGALEVT